MAGIARIRTQKILNNALIARLPDRVWRRYMECLLMAFEQDENGLLPTLFDMSFRLQLPERQLEYELNHLVNMGLLTQQDDRLTVLHYGGSMTNAERQAAYRERLNGVVR